MERPLFVKICGITSVEDALFAAAMGADAVGLLFAASSRRVTRNQAQEIVRRLPPEILSVGVFRDERPQTVVEIANTIGLRVVQLHGHESAEETRWVAERVPAVIRAFAGSDPALDRFEEYGDVRLLVDSPVPGSGEVFDWAVLERVPSRPGFILAGGLDPDNVGRAVSEVRPWGVDVSSGVEARPGVKDSRKVRSFIRAARAAHRDANGDTVFDDDELYDWAHDLGAS